MSCFTYPASVQTLQVDQFPDLNYGVDITSSDQLLAGDCGSMRNRRGVDVPLLAASPAVFIDCYEVRGDAPRALLADSLTAGADVTLNLGGSPPPDWLTAETRRRRASVIQTNASESAADGARRVLSALAALDAADTVVVTVGRHGAIARTSSGETASADALPIPASPGRRIRVLRRADPLQGNGCRPRRVPALRVRGREPVVPHYAIAGLSARGRHRESAPWRAE